MSDSRKKNGIDWKEGETLDDANSSPLGDIRAHGLPKINKAPPKDAALRKQAREDYLAGQQSKPYKATLEKQAKEENGVVVQSDNQDLSGEFENSEIERLTGKGNASKGLSRFGKK